MQVKDRLERERALERLLPDVLSEASGPARSSCVEAEVLAAWTSGHLQASEAAAVEAHLADCGHCQAVVGTFVRSAPPATTDSVWSRWQMRWLVPLLTAATAVTLYLLVPGFDARPVPQQTVSLADARRESPQAVPEADAARPPAAAPPSAANPVPGLAPRPVEAAPAPLAESAEAQSRRRALEAERLPQSKDRAGARAEPAPVTPAEPPKVTAETNTATPQLMRDRAVAAPRQEVPPAAPPPPPATAAAVPSPAAPLPSPVDATAPAKPAVSAPAEVGGAAVAERRADAAFSVRRQAGANVDITTPVPTHRFRIVDGQRVERTTTGGQRWESVARPSGGEMTAGAAPAADVCWIVGRMGAVWRTADGQVLVRVPFPQPVDLVAVAAESATTAVVTASDGRTFRTTDGGQSWK